MVVSLDPPEVEIQCHGGPAAVALVTRALADQGAQPGLPSGLGTLLDRLIAPGRRGGSDGLAATIRVAEILLDQVEGALEADLARVVAALDAPEPTGLWTSSTS